MNDWNVNHGDYVRDREHTNRAERKKDRIKLLRKLIISICLLGIIILIILFLVVPKLHTFIAV
jgi:hypothetical protein